MATDTKSISTESIETVPEATTMDNVSLEDENDIEQQKPGSPSNQDTTTTPRNRRKAIMGLVVLVCLVVGVTAALIVGLGRSDEAVAPSSSASSKATTHDNASITSQSEAPKETETAPQAALTSQYTLAGAELRGFSSDLTVGYASVEEFRADLTKTAEYVAHGIIQWNILHHGQQTDDQNDDMTATGVALEAGAVASMASANKQAVSAQAATGKASKTNNQEEDADEADIVKSDEHYVYAGHSTSMLVWDRQGNIVNEINTTTVLTEWGYLEPHYIRAILLTDEHVVMVTESYEDYTEEIVGLYDRNVTHIDVYTKPTDTNLDMTFVGTKSFNGFYQDARWMQDSNSIQILTGGSVRTWDFVDKLSPTYFPWMSKEDYATRAAEKAAKELIPELVEAVSRDLMVGGELPNMLRLNAWTSEDQGNEAWKKFGQPSLDQVMNSYSQVTSFSVSDFDSDEDLEASASVFFAPTNYPTLYGTDDKLVVALSKSEWDEEAQHTHETTFLLNLNVQSGTSGVSTEFQSVTTLEGRLQSKYAVDVQGNDLRVATTIQKWFPLDNVWAACDDGLYMYEDSCMTESIYEQCTEVALNCPKDKVVKTGCPYTFTCESDETNEADISSTDNYIHVFDIEQKGEIKEIGRIRIGEPHEVITAVRFGETFSYATTFDQRDPFYVLKLEAGQPPAISGKVTLEGFPSYLHPIGEGKLVGIGQNTTGTGLNQVNSGVMLSLFDVSDPSNPQVLDSYALDQGASSQAEWDFKSVTYDDGKLVIPATIYNDYSWDDAVAFEGFVVLDVDSADSDIEELYRINHAKQAGECSYCYAHYFSEFRSFAYDDGSLMTIHDTVIIGTNLTTGEEMWRLEPHHEGETKDCCW